jgi:hypothetical protein
MRIERGDLLVDARRREAIVTAPSTVERLMSEFMVSASTEVGTNAFFVNVGMVLRPPCASARTTLTAPAAPYARTNGYAGFGLASNAICATSYCSTSNWEFVLLRWHRAPFADNYRLAPDANFLENVCTARSQARHAIRSWPPHDSNPCLTLGTADAPLL